MTRLCDKDKKAIIADYVEQGSYNAVGRAHGVSPNTVKRIVTENADIAQNCIRKKEQNTADILAHMDGKRDKVNEIIDVYLDKLLDPKMLSRATPSQLTTALGTLIDKFTMAHTATPTAEDEEDGLSRALREEAERMNDGNIT